MFDYFNINVNDLFAMVTCTLLSEGGAGMMRLTGYGLKHGFWLVHASCTVWKITVGRRTMSHQILHQCWDMFGQNIHPYAYMVV